MGLADEAPREPHQDAFASERNVNASSVAIPQHQVYIHGYVMSSQPPQGPPRVYDLAEIEGRPQTQRFSNVPYPVPQYGNQYAPAHYGSVTPCASRCAARPGKASRALVTIGYILAWFAFFPHMLSIAGSLHLYKKGLLGSHRTAVLVCSYLEIAAFCLCAVASWSFIGTGDTYWVGTDYDYDYDDQVFWFGFVYIAVWGLSLLAAGIPRLVFSLQRPKADSIQEETVLNESSASRFRTSALATYIIGVFVPPVQIASMACSLHLLNRGQITAYKGRVMALVALEMCGWIIGASMSWFIAQNCSYSYEYFNGTTYIYQYCQNYYLGYIFLCIQFGFAVACGIPRVVFTFKGKRSANYVQIQ